MHFLIFILGSFLLMPTIFYSNKTLIGNCTYKDRPISPSDDILSIVVISSLGGAHGECLDYIVSVLRGVGDLLIVIVFLPGTECSIDTKSLTLHLEVGPFMKLKKRFT